MRYQQRQHQLCGIDAQIGAVAGRHLDHRVHAVDVEEKRQHEEQQALVVHDAFHRALQPCKCGAQHVVGAFLPVQLLHVFRHGNSEGNPPHRRDNEGNLHTQRRADAKARAAQHHRQASDKRNARADVAPRVAMGRNLVIPILGGGIHQERVVEHHGAVQHDGGYYVHHQKWQRMFRDAQRRAGNRARTRETHQELLLVARQIGQATQDGHQQSKHQGGNGFRIAPGHNH